MNRRVFVKNIAALAGASLLVPALPSLASAQEKRKARGGGGAELVDPNDGVAKAVGYIHQTKIPAKTCAGCSLYQKKEMKDGKEVGTCAIFAGKVVYGEGYCNSWAKK